MSEYDKEQAFWETAERIHEAGLLRSAMLASPVGWTMSEAGENGTKSIRPVSPGVADESVIVEFPS